MNKFHTLNLKGKLLSLEKPVVMGILNITPDSFYSKSRVESDILGRSENFLRDGAALIDLGGQSTRPGAVQLSAAEELERVLPAVKMIAKEFPEAMLSIDTFYSEVAKSAVEHGAAMINDISAGVIDPAMFETVASLQVPYVLMHMQGTPQTMQVNPQYADVVSDISFFFSEKIKELHLLGVHDIVLDPGFGFGKSLDDNYRLLKHFSSFSMFDKPLLAGMSRKGMIQKAAHTTAEGALAGSIAAHVIALMHGASILRVHDVKEAVDAVAVFTAMADSK